MGLSRRSARRLVGRLRERDRARESDSAEVRVTAIAERAKPNANLPDTPGSTAALASALCLAHRFHDPGQCAFIAALNVETQPAKLLLHLQNAEAPESVLPDNDGKIGAKTLDQGIPAGSAQETEFPVAHGPGP